jgi:hypothetical protein
VKWEKRKWEKEERGWKFKFENGEKILEEFVNGIDFRRFSTEKLGRK